MGLGGPLAPRYSCPAGDMSHRNIAAAQDRAPSSSPSGRSLYPQLQQGIPRHAQEDRIGREQSPGAL